MELRGKLVIAFIFAVATGLAAYAWIHQRASVRRSSEFWGTDGAICIRQADRVEFLRLEPDSGDRANGGQSTLVMGISYRVADSIEITRSRGLLHARHALVSDLSFEWNGGSPPAGAW